MLQGTETAVEQHPTERSLHGHLPGDRVAQGGKPHYLEQGPTSLPWEISFTAHRGHELYIAAGRSWGSGTMTCEIVISGRAQTIALCQRTDNGIKECHFSIQIKVGGAIGQRNAAATGLAACLFWPRVEPFLTSKLRQKRRP
jgi:hypothetical protein